MIQKTENKRRIPTVLFGSGQVGQMVRRLMGTDYKILCFADNNEAKWGTKILGIPVLSPAESLALSPQVIILCVTDPERTGQMSAQLASLGFQGTLLTPETLRIFDSRAAIMRLLAEQLAYEKIPGDIAELGVFRGDFAVLLEEAFPERTLHLFDTFEGFQSADVRLEQERNFSRARIGDFSDTSMEAVLERFAHPERIRVHKGWFPETFAPCEDCTFAFVSLDADLYEPTRAALPLFYDRLSPGGVLLIHDVNSIQFFGCKKAVQDFCHARGIYYTPVSDLHGSAVIRKV